MMLNPGFIAVDLDDLYQPSGTRLLGNPFVWGRPCLAFFEASIALTETAKFGRKSVSLL